MSRRLLVVTKYFSAGYGGTPEAVRLLAHSLLAHDVVTDVLANHGFYENVGELETLSDRDAPTVSGACRTCSWSEIRTAMAQPLPQRQRCRNSPFERLDGLGVPEVYDQATDTSSSVG